MKKLLYTLTSAALAVGIESQAQIYGRVPDTLTFSANIWAYIRLIWTW